MSLMYCRSCKEIYGPTILNCPICGSNDVERIQMEVSPPETEWKTTTNIDSDEIVWIDMGGDISKKES